MIAKAARHEINLNDRTLKLLIGLFLFPCPSKTRWIQRLMAGDVIKPVFYTLRLFLRQIQFLSQAHLRVSEPALL